MNRLRNTPRPVRPANDRRGNAAVECALVAPLLVLLVLAAIDVGQFVNVSQVVDNASHAGGRKAIRETTTNVSEVDAAVKAFLANSFPSVSSSDLDAATTVNVYDGSGTAITGSNLGLVSSGSSVTVVVTFDYEKVRWMPGFGTLSGKALKTTTVMRRE